jgi:hypothetical protein
MLSRCSVGPRRRLGSGLFQTQANRRRRRALNAIRSATAGAEHRHQRFGCFAAYRTVGLYRPKAGRRGVTLLAFVTLVPLIAFFTGRPFLTGRTLRPLGSLGAGLALRASDALNALSALRSGRTLRTRLALRTRRPGISAASAERKRNTNDEYGKNSHDAPRYD